MKKPATAVVFVVVAGLLAVAVAPKLMRVRNLQARSDRLAQELAVIKRQNALLENELRLLKSDPVYLERVARKKFNMAKEGEIVYKIEKDRGVEQPGSSLGS